MESTTLVHSTVPVERSHSHSATRPATDALFSRSFSRRRLSTRASISRSLSRRGSPVRLVRATRFIRSSVYSAGSRPLRDLAERRVLERDRHLARERDQRPGIRRTRQRAPAEENQRDFSEREERDRKGDAGARRPGRRRGEAARRRDGDKAGVRPPPARDRVEERALARREERLRLAGSRLAPRESVAEL